MEMLRERGLADRAVEAERRLPEVLETEQHLGLLSEFGIAADDLTGGLGDVSDQDVADEQDRADPAS